MTDRVFVCPLCSGELSIDGKRLLCPSGHSFDIASAGYVNLLRPGKLKNRSAGDDRGMVGARTRFLSEGYYEKNRDHLISLVKKHAKVGGVLVDAGCGEGYYTNAVNLAVPEMTVVGIDASKHACEAAAKGARRIGAAERGAYAVASLSEMPIADGKSDVVISLFAPCDYAEFARVLSRGGKLIIGSAGKKHLTELKKVLYGEDNVRDNEAIDHAALAASFGFEPIERSTVSFKADVEGKDALSALFLMTPYYWRTPKSGAEALGNLDGLSVTVEVDYTALELK